MKEIQKETKQYVTVYEAVDGTEFTSKEECKKYEESAQCVLMAKYSKLVIKSDTEWELFGVGSDESIVDVVRLNDEQDVNVILQLIALENPTISSKQPEWLIEKDKRLTTALKEDSLVFIGRGYEQDCFYLCITEFEMVSKLNSYRQ